MIFKFWNIVMYWQMRIVFWLFVHINGISRWCLVSVELLQNLCLWMTQRA